MNYSQRVKDLVAMGRSMAEARLDAEAECKRIARSFHGMEDVAAAVLDGLTKLCNSGAPSSVLSHSEGIIDAFPEWKVEEITFVFCERTMLRDDHAPPCFRVTVKRAGIGVSQHSVVYSESKSPLKAKSVQGHTLRVSAYVNDWRSTTRWTLKRLYDVAL